MSSNRQHQFRPDQCFKGVDKFFTYSAKALRASLCGWEPIVDQFECAFTNRFTVQQTLEVLWEYVIVDVDVVGNS